MSPRPLASVVFSDEPAAPPPALRPRTVPEAAAELGLTEQTIRRLIAECALHLVLNVPGVAIEGRSVVEFYSKMPAWRAKALQAAG